VIVTKQGLLTTVALRKMEVLKTGQGYHTCNRNDEQSEVTRPAAYFLPKPLMKRTFSDWARSTGPNTIYFAMDPALWPSQKCSKRL
jgi:hypothetical protein